MEALKDAKIYLVGGAVRDKLLNLPVIERDWVVVGATPEMLLSNGYQQVGRDFPVFLHPTTHEEYALARTERKSGKGYIGFSCDFGQDVTLEQDLIRRDLTINAIAMDADGTLIDPYHGIDDLKQKRLTHVSPAFREDPLRVLRVARFAARYHHLGFSIAHETMRLMQQMVQSGELNYLTAERVWKETEKALLTQDPQIYFHVLSECGALTLLFPQLTVDNGVKKALQQVVQLTNELEVRFATLCARMTNTKAVELLCDQLKVANSYRKIAIIAQKYVPMVHQLKQLNAIDILTILNGIDVWRNPNRLQKLIMISQAYSVLNSSEQVECDANYLYQSYRVAKNIDIKMIMNKGITGIDINKALQKLREDAITNLI